MWMAGFYNMIFLGLVAIVFIGFARPVVQIFTRDADVVLMASTTLRTISYGYVFYAWGMVIVQAFNGSGDTFTPTVLNLICFWLWQLPLAWFLAFHTPIGVNGIFIAIAVAQSSLALAGMLVFRRGKWKEQRI